MELQAWRSYRRGDRPTAERLCREALERSPQDASALHLLAVMALGQKRLRPAERLARMASDADPLNPEPLNTLGAALTEAGRFADAESAFERAIALAPSHAGSWRNLALARARAGKLGQAVETYRRAMALRPAREVVEDLAVACHEALDVPGLVDAYRRIVELAPDDPKPHSELLYALHYDPSLSPAELFAEHRRWAERHAEPLQATWRPHENGRDPDRRLRIGYVSAGFRNHPVTRFQLAEMAARKATGHGNPPLPDGRGSYHLTCYNSSPRDDDGTARVKALADDWRDVRGLSDAALADLIRADRIDVLVDLDGHDAGNRLLTFARKPAPVQATYNGYMSTTGMTAMDWRITDEWHDPVGMTEHLHTEKLYRLPGGNWCYAADANTSDAFGNGEHGQASTPAHATRRAFTFGSLNKLIKASEPCVKVWARVLNAVPGSRLLLLAEGAESSRAYQLAELGRRGLPADRVELIGRCSRAEYLDRLSRIDAGVDPFPFNGITTTADAFSVGVPVVTLAGNTFASRAGVSLLNAVGLPELIAADEDSYVRIAAELATDPTTLADARRRVCEGMRAGPLVDGVRHARELAAAYRFMWRAWCSRS